MYYCHRLTSQAAKALVRQLRFSQYGLNVWIGRQFSSCISFQGRKIVPDQISRQISFRCLSSVAGQSLDKKKVVFCGTPEVAASVLEHLLQAADRSDSTFEVSAVVSQPGRPRGRGNKKMPSEVHQLAAAFGFGPEKILCPEKTTEKQFLDTLRRLSPDLCITAAYGKYLSTGFLNIPRYGTINIHPSLLPKYRGAAPVQRALQDGQTWTGVSLLFTVKEMDAGPIIAQKKVRIDSDIQAPELLTKLFATGTDLLLDNLDIVWAGLASKVAVAQDDSQATHAAKIRKEEAVLDFSRPAQALHNQVRAFAGWPGTAASFALQAADRRSDDESSSGWEPLQLKIVRTRVARPSAWKGPINSSNSGGSSSDHLRHVSFRQDGMFIPCGDGTVLEILEVQAPGKKVMAAKDFANGLQGKVLVWQGLQQAVGTAA